MAKILILDIETAPILALVWKTYKENIGTNQVLKSGHILSYAAKWLGENGVMSGTCFENGDDSQVVEDLISLMDEADVIVAHNGNKFDIPWINGRALVHGYNPPSPSKYIDTLLTARKEFNFPHNSLKGLGEYLNCEYSKYEHKEFPGFELWLECLKGNEKAWREMVKYNKMDVLLLEEIYLKMRPWIRNHPNIAVLEEEGKHICPSCGGDHLQRRGFAYTNAHKYQRYQCISCGSWSRTRFTEYPKENRKKLLGNAV